MKDQYYFDNAATTWPKPEPVYDFMDEFFRSHGVRCRKAVEGVLMREPQEQDVGIVWFLWLILMVFFVPTTALLNRISKPNYYNPKGEISGLLLSLM